MVLSQCYDMVQNGKQNKFHVIKNLIGLDDKRNRFVEHMNRSGN